MSYMDWRVGVTPREQASFGGVLAYNLSVTSVTGVTQVSRTFRKREISWSSPRVLQEKRAKQHLQEDIEEELRLIRSPLLKWERERAKSYQIPCD